MKKNMIIGSVEFFPNVLNLIIGVKIETKRLAVYTSLSI